MVWDWRQSSLTSILFFFFIPLEEEKRMLYNIFLVLHGRLRKSRSASSWPLCECEFIWHTELREAAFPAGFTFSLIPVRECGEEVVVFTNCTLTCILVPTCLHFCVVQNSAVQLTKICRRKPSTYMIAVNLCECLISECRNLWKEKGSTMWLIWSTFG